VAILMIDAIRRCRPTWRMRERRGWTKKSSSTGDSYPAANLKNA